MTRVENYLDALANMEEGPDYPKVTRTRVENYLDAICKNAGRRKVMPTAGSKYRGKIVQYVGETNGTYTKGYFYVCNGESEYTSEVVFSSNKISCPGIKFLAFIKGVAPNDFIKITNGTMVYVEDANIFKFTGKDETGNTVAYYQQYVDDFINDGFVFSGTFSDGETIGFTCTVEEGSGTYEWSQIDVQPGGGGGGMPISAGKGIEIKDSAPMSITINVTGELPSFEGELPLTINVDNVSPGTTMWDLFSDGKIGYDEIFYWDSTYEVTTTLDENIVSVQGPIMDVYMLQFNGAGTTTGTVTAERDEYGHEVYTANITVTSVAGEVSKKISRRSHDLGMNFMFAVMGMDYRETISGDEALEAFGGVDGFNAFVDAAANGSDFYASIEGQNVYFESVTSAPSVLWLQHGAVGSMAPSIVQIYYESGDDPFVEMTKERVIDIFNDDFDGLVPAATGSGRNTKFLRGDGTWAEFNGLRLDNTTAYTPTGNYNPATKKYVDDAVGNIDTLLANLISGGGAE